MKKWILLSAGFLSAIAALLFWVFYQLPKVEGINTVRKAMNDPESAIFNNVTYSRESGATCGYVNAKNKLGGYTGNRSFVILKTGVIWFQPNYYEPGSIPSRDAELLEINIKALGTYIDLIKANCKDGDIK